MKTRCLGIWTENLIVRSLISSVLSESAIGSLVVDTPQPREIVGRGRQRTGSIMPTVL